MRDSVRVSLGGVLVALLGGLGAAAWAGGVEGLMPEPKVARALEGTVAPAAGECTLEGYAGTPGQYALEVLARELGPAAGVRLVVATSQGMLTEAAREVGLEGPPEDRWDEAFVLDCGASDPARVTLTGGPGGLVYGAYALDQLAQREDGQVRLARCAVSDWPSLLTRAYTGVPRDPSAASFARELDWLARWRINACYYEIYGDAGQDAVPPEVAVIAAECARRGITLYGEISNWRTERLVGRELCACNEGDLARFRRYSEEFVDHGCGGLVLLFDDITQAAAEHPLNCEACKARFGNLAAAQLELARPVLEVGRARGITRLVLCPTPYYQGWPSTQSGKLDGRQYYATWGAAPELEGVQVFHCLLRGDEMRELADAGLRDYIYWCNGFYDYDMCVPEAQKRQGLWGGLGDAAYTWYLHRWDPGRGVVALKDAYEALRELPKLTQHAWLCYGGDWAFAQWGAYCWEPAGVGKTDGKLRDALYGTEAARAYERWAEAVRAWYPKLGAMGGLTRAQRREFVQGLVKGAAEAQAAAAQFVAAPVAGVAGPAHREDIGGRMTRSGEALAEAAAARTLDEEDSSQATEDGRCVVTLGPETQTSSGGVSVRERRMEVEDFWSRYSLRFSQTQDADGSRHRTQWHFGAGLGMLGPSYRNWYDAGFVDVLVDGASLDSVEPAFSRQTGENGDELMGVWPTPAGEVSLRFGLFEGGLRIRGTGPAGHALAVRLFAIPGAGWGAWEDMDKFVVSASGETAHGTPVTLQPGEAWLFLADRTYDVPHDMAEGPCAVWFRDGGPQVTCDNGNYVVQVDAAYPAGTGEFELVVWDFHGQTNEAALAALREITGGATAR